MRLYFPSEPTDRQITFLRSLKVKEELIQRIKQRSEADADLAIALVLAEKKRSHEKIAALKKELKAKWKKKLKQLQRS